MIAPTIHSARLTLRMVAEAHWPAYRAYRLSARSTVAPGPDAEAIARGHFDDFTAHWHQHGFGRFILVETATGQAIGHAGPFQGKGHPEHKISWTLWSQAHEGNHPVGGFLCQMSNDRFWECCRVAFSLRDRPLWAEDRRPMFPPLHLLTQPKRPVLPSTG